MSLVELIVSMAVGASVLVALVGVVFATGNISTTWSQRIYDAEVVSRLPSEIQADAHRYLACSPDGSTLTFCVAGGQAVVIYASSSPCPCDLTRTVTWTDASGAAHIGSTSVVARHLLRQPVFTHHCDADEEVSGGYVSISKLQYPGDVAPLNPQTVFFRGPGGTTC